MIDDDSDYNAGEMCFIMINYNLFNDMIFDD